jgi:cytochrome c2
MRLKWLPAGVAVLTMCDAAGTLAAGDVGRGEVIFKKCYACHSVVPGETGLSGPNLSGVVGRAVASAPEFDYSDALEALPARGYERWTRATLDAFITSPEDLAPGTTMTFVGMSDPKERTDLIAYLARTGAGSGEE